MVTAICLVFLSLLSLSVRVPISPFPLFPFFVFLVPVVFAHLLLLKAEQERSSRDWVSVLIDSLERVGVATQNLLVLVVPRVRVLALMRVRVSVLGM